MNDAIRLFLSFRPRARLEVGGLVVLMLLGTATYVGDRIVVRHLRDHNQERSSHSSG